MHSYYSHKLSAERLKLCYEIAPLRVKRYFEAEIEFILGFRNRRFDVVVCIQNGISAFKVDQRKLIGETMCVTRSGGTLLFSSYSESPMYIS